MAKPRRGDTRGPTRPVSPLPGLAMRGIVAYQGLTPLAIFCRPFGAQNRVAYLADWPSPLSSSRAAVASTQ